MKIIHRSKLRHVEFTFAAGDIFDASVDAIVNSEQTNFVLSGNPDSLSGQIWNRYGGAVKRELDAATEGQVLGPGTVIETSGGEDFKRIFHAGFHDPDDWLDSTSGRLNTEGVVGPSREFRETGYFAAIGSCMAQILDSTVAQKLESIAFPLIGCGRFGLDEKMLMLQFLDAIEEFDDRLPEGKSLHAWLVIRDRAQFESAAGTFLDLLMQARNKLVSVRVKQSGVSILDRLPAVCWRAVSLRRSRDRSHVLRDQPCDQPRDHSGSSLQGRLPRDIRTFSGKREASGCYSRVGQRCLGGSLL